MTTADLRAPSAVVVPARTRPAAVLAVVLVVAGSLVVVPWWLDTARGSIASGAAALTGLGRLTGLLAAYLCVLQLLLFARIPLLLRVGGFATLARWHRALGTGTVVLVAVHGATIIGGYAWSDRRSPLTETADVVTTYPYMIRATVAFGLLLALGITSGRLMRRLRYEIWWAVHLGAYATVVLAFGHQVRDGEQFVGHPLRADVARGLLIAVFAAAIWWRVLAPLRRAYIHRTAVESVVPESSDTVSVWITGEGLQRMSAAAGQFVLVRFLSRGHWGSSHPYSLSAPVRDGRLRITVRADGDHSTALQHIRVGTRAIVEGPYGSFTSAAAPAGTPALLVGAGSGVVPLLPIAEQLVADGSDVVVVNRASDETGLLLREEFGKAAQRGTLTYHAVVGRRSELGIDPLAAAELVRLVPDVMSRDVWICGPTGMAATVVHSCLASGSSPRRIHLEEFTL